eukprot:scaffold69309_cov65-Phaeocystis_antarctica.AAC.13
MADGEASVKGAVERELGRPANRRLEVVRGVPPHLRHHHDVPSTLLTPQRRRACTRLRTRPRTRPTPTGVGVGVELLQCECHVPLRIARVWRRPQQPQLAAVHQPVPRERVPVRLRARTSRSQVELDRGGAEVALFVLDEGRPAPVGHKPLRSRARRIAPPCHLDVTSPPRAPRCRPPALGAVQGRSLLAVLAAPPLERIKDGLGRLKPPLWLLPAPMADG